MKIEYANQLSGCLLDEMEPGTVFRPTHSEKLYILSSLSADYSLFAEGTILDNYLEDPQDMVLSVADNYDECAACFDLTANTICLMPRSTRVHRVECVLQLKD
jgi:hypothetical protein